MTKGLEKQTFGDFLCFFRGQTIDRRKGKPLSQEQLGILLTDQLGLIISRNKVNNWETNKISPHPQRDRELMVAVVEILKKHNGIKSLDDANQLFEAGNYQALTDQEINQIDPGWKQLVTQQNAVQPASFQQTVTYPYFQASPVDLRRSFSSYIADKIKGFVGREFIFDAISNFIKGNPSGYLIIRGDPGIGKTALLAKLIDNHGYIHHFNIALQNIRSARDFLENICLQLIARYNLPHISLPQNATENSSFLSQCLSEAASVRGNHPVVIAIDALDEADHTSLPVDVNSLYLPPSLPDGVYIIVTVRRVVDLHLQVSNPQTLDLEADSEGNLRDIKTYIEKYVVRKQMHDRLSAWAVTREQFTDTLVKKSQGNFMYLYYILPAIEGGKFADGRLDELPEGLLAYYQRHWRQMREGNERDFDKLYEPIVCILGVAQEPITLEHISNWTKLEKSQVKQAIDKWYEFLLDTRQAEQHSYRIYHASFQDFLKNEVDLTKYHKMIADYYLRLANMK